MHGWWHFPGAVSVLSNIFVIAQGLQNTGVYSALLPVFLPSLSRARSSSNILLLNPRDLTQAFIRDVAGDRMALWPTHCCRTHWGCPCSSGHASRLLTPCHLHHLMEDMLLVAEECKDPPVLVLVPGFKKGVCCTGYRLFFICRSPPSYLDPFCPCCLQPVCLLVPSSSSPHTVYPWMNLFLSGIRTKTLPFPPCFSVPMAEESKAEG